MESRWFVLELVELETGSGRHDGWSNNDVLKINHRKRAQAQIWLCLYAMWDYPTLMTYLSSEK